MKPPLSLILFAALTILMWGFWGFFGKLALERGMSPIAIFLGEVVVGVLCSLILVVLFLPTGNSLRYNSWNVFGLASGAGLAFGLVFYYLALNEGQATLVVPITATYPVVSVLLSFAILGERPRLIQWIGIFLVILGVVLLLSAPLTKAQHKQETSHVLR